MDTCVIIDALQAREPFAENAQEIFIAAANKQFTGCITAKSSTDIYYLTHRVLHSDIDTRKILSKLFVLFEVLDSAGMDCRRALSSDICDYEDAVMVETAIRSDVDYIVTRNQKDYVKSSVMVLSPSDFLLKLKTED